MSDQYEDEFYDGEDTNRRSYRHSEQEQSTERPGAPKKKYGNMLVLYDGKFLITLGPDCNIFSLLLSDWCFLPTFIIFLVVSFLTVRFVLTSTTNIYLHVATIIICCGTCLSYLAVATSNPGIITEQPRLPHQLTTSTTPTTQDISNPNSKNKKKQCKRCNLVVQRTTFHCSDCDVCISEFDHHCPWTSKCIGGGNLYRFYFFLAMIPVFIIYSFMVFGIVMSEIAVTQAAGQLQVSFVGILQKIVTSG